jgi:hypothetical protein
MSFVADSIQPSSSSVPDLATFPRAVEWGLDHFDAYEDLASRFSIGMGLAGLGFMLALLATAAPIAIEIVNYFSSANRLGFLATTTVIQSIMLPPVISGSIVVSAVFFWHVPISLRFLVASTLVIPAGVLFIVTIAYLESPAELGIAKPFFASMFALFIGAGTISLTVQMWSPWTLSHLRDDDRPYRSLGTRSLFELTGITAISFAIIISLSNDPKLNSSEFIIGLVLVAAFGILVSFAGIGLFFSFLREHKNQRRPLLVASLLTFGAATLLPSFIAVQEFGWNAMSTDLVLIVLASAYGTSVIGMVAMTHLWWLRLCGWRCVGRREVG